MPSNQKPCIRRRTHDRSRQYPIMPRSPKMWPGIRTAPLREIRTPISQIHSTALTFPQRVITLPRRTRTANRVATHTAKVPLNPASWTGPERAVVVMVNHGCSIRGRADKSRTQAALGSVGLSVSLRRLRALVSSSPERHADSPVL